VPLFSIVIPVFNRSSSLWSTLDSVFKQRFTDFEVVVVDDGSTDELIDSLSNYIPLSNFVYHYQTNAGVSTARNNGALLAHGEYLVFLDSDDHVTENWLLDYVNEIDAAHPDLIYCGINRMKEDIVVAYTDPRNPFGNGVDVGNVIPGSFCIRRSFFDLVGGYDSQLSYGENTELGFRIQQNNPTIEYISTPNLLYSMQEFSHGKNVRNKMNGLVYTIQKHSTLFNHNSSMKKRFLSIAGVSAIQCSEFSQAQALFWEALLTKPVSIESLFRYLVSLSPSLSKILWKVK
jgi:glycosyltransferase involved in cell wall biosynthesis